MADLPKKYNHQETEAKWQKYWLKEGTYKWDTNIPRDASFVIDTPPPTVSGYLHMGHIFSYTQADFVARYQRMTGKNVFYPMGFDDNGLPTERLVEKVKNIRGSQMQRDAFIAICKEVVEVAEEEFRHLFKSVALSVDWDQEYHTISDTSRRISQLSFLDLFQKDKAYRKLQPTLWDPIDRTALAQADIDDVEHNSVMHEIYFTTEEGKQIAIATTRPELLAACVAVFYHPDDTRYQYLEGQAVITPLFGVPVPMLADPMVDQEKGTGLVMCCTFGDQTDIHWWQTHELPTRVILDRAGRLTNLDKIGSDDWPSQNLTEAQLICDTITGLKGKEAREVVVNILKEKELYVVGEDITHVVKCAERSGAPLEILVTPQWFISILAEKKALLEKSNQCNWNPPHMKIRLDQWIKGLSWDWCISRQRFFGVPFPIWYSKRKGEEGKILIAHPDDLPVDPLQDLPRGYSREEVEAEQDVMDTWATSSVTPQLSSHGITKNLSVDYERHQHLFPADLRPQAHEIIRSWAFYTIVKAHLHEDTIPWKHLMISGWCLAPDKTKMSKSKGNVITPVGLIEEKGSDVVRYWASTSKLGTDTAYSDDVLKIGKKLVTKLWNATKFAAIHLDKIEGIPTTVRQDIESGTISEILDQWILSQLHTTIEKATTEFEKFEYCNARIAIESFFWNDFCDNYLELVKTRAYGEDPNITKTQQQSAIYTLYHTLKTLLILFAPVLPHITEELFSHIFESDWQKMGSLHAKNTWPKAEEFVSNTKALEAGNACVTLLGAIRKLKADKNVSLKWPLDYVNIGTGNSENAGKEEEILGLLQDLKYTTNADELRWENTLTLVDNDNDVLDCTTEDKRFRVITKFAKAND